MAGKISYNSFYCIKCGKKGLILPRKVSKSKEKFHRKKLYCPHCKLTINHVECRNDVEEYIFQQDFEDGMFLEEVEESLKECANENK